MSVSSSQAQKGHLLDGKSDTFWQSSGERPHWVRLSLPVAGGFESANMLIREFGDSYVFACPPCLP